MTVPGRVTIGLPTINRSRLAQRAIGSVLGQTYRDIELIVSDDASTDDTVASVEQIVEQIRDAQNARSRMRGSRMRGSKMRGWFFTSKRSGSDLPGTSIFACGMRRASFFCYSETTMFSCPRQ